MICNSLHKNHKATIFCGYLSSGSPGEGKAVAFKLDTSVGWRYLFSNRNLGDLLCVPISVPVEALGRFVGIFVVRMMLRSFFFGRHFYFDGWSFMIENIYKYMYINDDYSVILTLPSQFLDNSGVPLASQHSTAVFHHVSSYFIIFHPNLIWWHQVGPRTQIGIDYRAQRPPIF